MNTQLGHLPAKAQLPKAQPSVLSPISNQSHGTATAAISEICSQSRKSVAFWCGKHRPSGEPFNRAGLGRKNHDVRDAPAAFAGSRLERPITPWARISVIISRSPDGDKYRLGALAVDSRGVPARDALAERFTSRYSWMPATMALPSCRVHARTACETPPSSNGSRRAASPDTCLLALGRCEGFDVARLCHLVRKLCPALAE